MEKYSQSDEQHYILNYLQNFTGRFLDIGAYDGVKFSNTYAITKLGWSGVCIEPEPTSFNNLVNAHNGNDKIELVNAALAVKPGLVKFFDSSGGAVSTTLNSHAEKWGQHFKYKKFWVNTITMEDIISTFGMNFDFISLDVEGTNLELLRTIDLQYAKLLCIEHENKDAEIMEYCEGFKLLYKSGENLVLAR